MNTQIQDKRAELKKTHQKLEEKGISLTKVHEDTLTSFKKYKPQLQAATAQIKRKLEQLAQQESPSQDSRQLVLSYFKNAMALGFLTEQQTTLKSDQKDAWSAAKGMKGMQRAMQLFICEAATSLMSFITKGAASSTMSTISTGIGLIGTGIMGGAQFLMMMSGLFKARAGIKHLSDMRQSVNQDTAKLRHISDVFINKALTRKVVDDQKQSRWQFLEKAIPGTTLSIGQGLMFGWSATSLGLILSGVGAPAGIGLMLGLLIPGVALTLAAALPKIGLESILGNKLDQKCGAFGSDEGFDALEYMKDLPNDAESLAKKANALSDLLDELKHKPDADLDQYLIPANQATGFKALYSQLEKIDRLENFSEQLAKSKLGKSCFLTDNVIEYKKAHPLLSLKNIKNPLQIRHSKLFNPNGERICIKKHMHFQAARVTNTSDIHVRDNANKIARDILKEFALKQARAELKVIQSLLAYVC